MKECHSLSVKRLFRDCSSLYGWSGKFYTATSHCWSCEEAEPPLDNETRLALQALIRGWAGHGLLYKSTPAGLEFLNALHSIILLILTPVSS